MLSLQTKNKKLKRLIDLKVKNSNINNFSVPVINLSCINRKNIYCFVFTLIVFYFYHCYFHIQCNCYSKNCFLLLICNNFLLLDVQKKFFFFLKNKSIIFSKKAFENIIFKIIQVIFKQY